MAVLQIEIGQRNAPVLLVGEMPGETGRDRGRADAAARADAGDGLPTFWLSDVLRSGLSLMASPSSCGVTGLNRYSVMPAWIRLR